MTEAKSMYAVVTYVQAKYITALVEAHSEVEARWKGLLALEEAGYDTHGLQSNPAIYVYKIDVNEVVFNPSKRIE